ncbi:MAG: biosynthetic-type acetolactate synthase large subunit [Candidatus Omnitrophica bacterium]|nr:biosynthetic-type acetolactate synthase large subunit [Candidatus Omnitrophota bacterium]
MKKMTGAHILVESLLKEGVEVMFGYPGGSVLPFFDVLMDAPLRHVLMRHEQAAAHAADSYARVTGKVGVCVATSGPGATNLVTGIANAYMDSIPMVAITGQVKTFLIGNDAFQEADVTGITRPITKHNYLVKDVRNLARIVKEAFYIASTGRPGPVVIDLPVDVTVAETEFTYPKSVTIRSYKPTYKGHVKQIEKAADVIVKSKRPVLYVGGGIILANASQELREFVSKTGIPITTTLLALGSFPETDPLALEMLGMHGTAYANHAVQESDLLIAIGARFDDRVTGKLDEFAPHAQIIHIDIDPTAISKNVEVDIPIVGDCKHVLRELNKIAKPPKIDTWIKQIKTWKKKYPLKYDTKTPGLAPQFVIEKLYEATQGKAVIATGVGQHQMWAAQFYKYSLPRHFVSSGGLGTMGFGFPAAIGAQVGRPNETVICIDGDGSFQMTSQELATAVVEKLPIKIALIDNGYLGMVRQWQELFYKKRYSHTCIGDTCPPDFIKLAEAYGACGIRVTKEAEVMPAIKEALKIKDRPCLLDFRVRREENVFPMVAAGRPLHEMLGAMA